jgi:hypothetical protein
VRREVTREFKLEAAKLIKKCGAQLRLMPAKIRETCDTAACNQNRSKRLVKDTARDHQLCFVASDIGNLGLGSKAWHRQLSRTPLLNAPTEIS